MNTARAEKLGWVDIKIPSDGRPYAKAVVEDFVESGLDWISYGVENGEICKVYASVYGRLYRGYEDADDVFVRMVDGRVVLYRGKNRKPTRISLDAMRQRKLFEKAVKVGESRTARNLLRKKGMSVSAIADFMGKSDEEVAGLLRSKRDESVFVGRNAFSDMAWMPQRRCGE